MKLEVKLSKENTHIENSYLIKLRKSMENEMDYILALRKARKYPITRSLRSYVNEWMGHNRLYNLSLFKSHTKDVDLEENQSLFWEIIWFILGGF